MHTHTAYLQLLPDCKHFSSQHILFSAQFLPLCPLSLHLILSLVLLHIKPATEATREILIIGWYASYKEMHIISTEAMNS